jgi:hypothetical protein
MVNIKGSKISPKVKVGSGVNTGVLEEPRRKLRETREVIGGGRSHDDSDCG